MCIFCVIRQSQEDGNPKNILKSIVEKVEAQEALKLKADKIQERKDYCENVKDSQGMSQVISEIHDYNEEMSDIVFTQNSLIRRYVITNQYNFRLN